MKMTCCELFDGYNCRYYPQCSCMGFNRETLFENNPLCNDCPTIDECGSLGCNREKKEMTERCIDCDTPDTCNAGGCTASTIEQKLGLDPCIHGPNGCKRLCGVVCLDRAESKNDCCNDSSDCNESCNCVVGNEDPDTYIQSLDAMYKAGCQLDEGCAHAGQIDECPRCQTPDTPELDGRNEGPVNRFGCSYVDCGCERPCYLEPDNTIINKTVNITINGDNYGDINV